MKTPLLAVFVMSINEFISLTVSDKLPPELRTELESLAAKALSNDQALRNAVGRYLRNEDFWKQLDGLQFEKELAAIYARQGYQTSFTPQVGDDGIDIILQRGKEYLIVQCKAHQSPVGVKDARELYGVLMAHKNAQRAILASVSGFTTAAVEFASNCTAKPLELLGLVEILALQNGSAPSARSYNIEKPIPRTGSNGALDVRSLLRPLQHTSASWTICDAKLVRSNSIWHLVLSLQSVNGVAHRIADITARLDDRNRRPIAEGKLVVSGPSFHKAEYAVPIEFQSGRSANETAQVLVNVYT